MSIIITAAKLGALQWANQVALIIQFILALELQAELLQMAGHILPRQALHIHHLQRCMAS